MKLSVLFSLILTIAPVVVVSAQTQSNVTSSPVVITPDAATKSDLRHAVGTLSKQLSNAEAQAASAQHEAELKSEAEAQATAAKLQDQIAQQAEADRRARILLLKEIGAIVALGLLVVIIITGMIRVNRKSPPIAVTADNGPKKSPTPEELYGLCLLPQQVRSCLDDNDLTEGLFTITLPEDGLAFEYRAKKMSDGGVVAYFKNNDGRAVALELPKLRKIAKTLYQEEKLSPLSLNAHVTR